jgi:4-carboxymuconolactone decarboxylase
MTPFDPEERMAEIIGKPERIAPLAEEEFDEAARELVIAVRETLGVRGMDKIPQVFGVMLKHPELFRLQMEMGVELLGRGSIPVHDRELAILRNAWLCGAPYEWGQHVDIARRYGLVDEEIERITTGSSEPGWSRHDAAILRGVEELHANKMISDETWAVLAESWNEKQLMEFPVLIGQYFMIAIQQNALRVRLSDHNPGLSHR